MAITYRAFQTDDISEVVQVANVASMKRGDPERMTGEWLEQVVAAPHIHAEADFSVALSAGSIVAASLMTQVREGDGMMLADVILHPDYLQSEIVAELIQRSEARALQRAAAELPDEQAVHLNLGVVESRSFLRAALEEIGYREVRRQYEMRIALDSPMAAPDFPSGYELRPFEPDQDARTVHAVFQECFADHWGGVAQTPFERWAYQLQAPAFDPALWHILYHQNEIAAICLCEIGEQEGNLGIVEVLGVRPAFRRRGLGGLLLRHAFHDFQGRAYANVALGVDTQNATNAVALYENAGMHIEGCTLYYRKVLRGNPADIDD